MKLDSWWSGRTDRMVLIFAIAVRLGGAGELLLVLPLVAPHAKHAWPAGLLGVALLVETAVVIAAWIRDDRLAGRVMIFDLVWNAAALILSALFSPQGTWADFAYPYTTFISFTLGLASRRMSVALAAGMSWATVAVVKSLVLQHAPLLINLAGSPAYIGNPALGCVSAALLTRMVNELRTAERAAAKQATALARQRERAWYSRALHDRVLQTLEALARPGWLEETTRAEVATQATWLRRFVETGDIGAHDELLILLEAAVYRAARAGLRVELNAAHLHHLSNEARMLSRPSRLAIVHAVIETLSALSPTAGRVTIRIQPELDGLLVTLLVDVPADTAAEVDAESLSSVRGRLEQVGGRLDASGLPYVELWVPNNPRTTLAARN